MRRGARGPRPFPAPAISARIGASRMQTPSIIASRYRVLRELGRGGMGVVYTVEHVHTGDQLALKLLLGAAAKDPQAIERFKREARASARIKSDHVVKVVDADVAPELDGAPFLVMELLNGVDLQKQLEARGRFPPEEACYYLQQAARALDRSHAIGIVHRDLKPENLFLHQREDGSTILKILDFGISKMLGGDAGNDIAGAGMTKTGAVMGTPLYMSPEQARGRVSEIGPQTDVWAMGLIATQLLSGEVYWRANTVAELMAQIIYEPLYNPSERWPWIPPAVDAWFARSCAREPGGRFGSVGEQMEALGAALQGVAPAPGAVVVAPARAPSASPLTGPSAAALGSLSPIAGARTTAAVASEAGVAPQPGGRMGAVFVGVAVAACAAVGVAFFLHGHGPISAELSIHAADPESTGSATSPAVPPPSMPAAVAPQPPPPSPPSAPPSASSAAAAHPAPAHPAGHAAPPAPPRSNVAAPALPPPPAAEPPAPPPRPASQPKPAATRFDPSSL